MKTAIKTTTNKPKLSVSEIITQALIAKIKTDGVLPWEKDWEGSIVGPNAPRNITSKAAYRGINIWALTIAGFKSPWWGSYKQWAALGGQVTKGSKGTRIRYVPTVWVDANGNQVKHDDPARVKRVFRRPKYYTVFNIEQVEGVDAPKPKTPEKPTVAPLPAADALLADYKTAPPVSHGGDACYYLPSSDRIQMAHREAFKSPEGYYVTLFHEHIHGTGHESRLDREGITKATSFGNDQYAYEELVAELGAAFLSSLTGVWDDAVEGRSAAYLQSWLKKFESDPEMLVTAASEAQRAAEYIIGCKLDDYPPLD